MWSANRDYIQDSGWYRPAAAGGGGTTTFDPANNGTGHTLSNGNLTVTGSGTNAITRSVAGHSSGKYYFEVTTTAANNAIVGGVATGAPLTSYLSNNNQSMGAFCNGSIIGAAGGTTTGDSFNGGGTIILGVALDLDNKTFWYKRLSPAGIGWNANGTADPATNTNGATLPAGMTGATVVYAGATVGTAGDNYTANFGGSAYTGTPPAGFGNW